MKMNFFYLLTVAVVPSCRAYIKGGGGASFSFRETKFPQEAIGSPIILSLSTEI